MQVRSPESLKGDIKEKNPWNGKVDCIEEDVAKNMVYGGVKKINEGLLGKNINTIIESCKNGSIEYSKYFQNGVLYLIDGIYYNSHESLNYYWGAAMSELGYTPTQAECGAIIYHFGAYLFQSHYRPAGPMEEVGHKMAQMTGYFNFGVPDRGKVVKSNPNELLQYRINYQYFNNSVQLRGIGK